MMSTLMEAPPHIASVMEERVALEPIPVFVGPKEGWAGPVLAARTDEADDAEPAKATAFAEKDGKGVEQGAPLALKSVIKAPGRLNHARFTPQARARVAAAARRVSRKPQRR